MNTTNPNVVVCSAGRAEKHLLDTKNGRGNTVAGLISLASPPVITLGLQRPTPEAAAVAESRLDLTFDDIVFPSPGKILPTMSDVDQILSFGFRFNHFGSNHSRPTRVIIHCYAGHSRSTAAALMLFLQGMRAATDTEILRAFTSACEERSLIRPNYLMLKLADKAMEAGGRLLDLDAQLNVSLSRMY